MLVGLLFSLFVAPGLVEDLEGADEDAEMLPRAEIAHWLFAAGFLFFGLVLLAEAIVGPAVFRQPSVARLPLAVARAASRASGSG